jgi:hypothetical protein
MIGTLPATRIVRGASGATLSHQFTDSDGEPAAPSGTVTVSVTRSDGTTVSTGAVAGTSTDPRTASLAVSEVADVDWLTAVWSDDGTEVATDTVEVVGGVIMDFTTAKTIDPALTDKSASFARARRATEDTLTQELGRSPFERFYTERLDGTGTCELRVTWPDVIAVDWVKVWTSSTAYTSFTSTELAAIPATGLSRRLLRTDGSPWPYGTQNIEIGYRFGMLALPTDIRDNLVLAIRHHMAKFAANMPFLGQTVEIEGGGVLSQNRPGLGRSITGNDEVDASIRRYAFLPPRIA